jgi:ABC-type microcin C transport system duplicated ATPase subunit YejF
MSAAEPLLRVTGLQKLFPIRKGFLKRTVGHVRAVDGVDFHIDEGETLGWSARAAAARPPRRAASCARSSRRPARSHAHADGVATVELRPAAELRALRREMQMIFQDPFTSLNPRMTLLDSSASRCWCTA